MSETRLREAYTLMKQGDKRGASNLVQDVLREDRDNPNAWWLFSHLIDDEDKLVKSLEKVLALNPEHLGARKRLSELRPEYAHLYKSGDDEKVKVKNIDASQRYWDKLNQPKPAPAKSNLGTWSVILLLGVLLCGAMTIFNIAAASIAEDEAIAADATPTVHYITYNTPESVAQTYVEAFYRQDISGLHNLICPAYKAELDEQTDEFELLDPYNTAVNFRGTRFSLVESNSNRAFVAVNGVTVVTHGGVTYRMNWNELTAYDGYDYHGVRLRNIDGRWLICD